MLCLVSMHLLLDLPPRLATISCCESRQVMQVSEPELDSGCGVAAQERSLGTL